MDELFKVLGLSTPFIYAGATYALFHWLDVNASEEAKAALSRLLRVRDYDAKKVSSAIVEVFDRIYTYPLLTWRAFLRSTLITLFITLVYIYEFVPSSERRDYDYVPLGVSTFININTDYVSLLIIRKWLTFSSKRPVFALLTGSLIGAGALFATFLFRAYFIFGDFLETPTPSHIFATLRQFFLKPVLVIAFSLDHTFLMIPASINFAWLPLFGTGLLAIRIFNLLTPVVSKVQWFLKGGPDHPLTAVGYMAGAIVFVIAVVLRFFLPAPEPAHAPDHAAQLVLSLIRVSVDIAC